LRELRLRTKKCGFDFLEDLSCRPVTVVAVRRSVGVSLQKDWTGLCTVPTVVPGIRYLLA
jgi:hypothetical protein